MLKIMRLLRGLYSPNNFSNLMEVSSSYHEAMCDDVIADVYNDETTDRA